MAETANPEASSLTPISVTSRNDFTSSERSSSPPVKKPGFFKAIDSLRLKFVREKLRKSSDSTIQEKVESERERILNQHLLPNLEAANQEARTIVARDIKHERLKKELELAKLETMKDPLTGLPNRRWFQDQLPKRVKQASRTGEPLWLAFIDIDDFRIFNSALGHAGGDAALKLFAQLPTREEEPIIRLAGDELAQIIDENIDIDGVKSVIKRYQDMLNLLSTEKFKDTPIQPDATQEVKDKFKRELTISVGVAKYEGETLDEFVAKANRAMYNTKQRGKNSGTIAVKDTNDNLKLVPIG